MNTASIIVGGNEVEMLFLTVVESANVIHHYVSFGLQTCLDTRDITINFGKNESYKVVSSTFDGTKYIYTAVPEETNRLLNSVFTEYTGNATVQNLCSKVGIGYNNIPPTNSNYWYIPSMRLKGFLQYLANYAEVSNGGGCKCFIDLQGKLNLVDLKNSWFRNRFATAIIQVESDISNTDWYLDYSGSYDIMSGRLDKISRRQVTLQKGYSKAQLWVNDTTGYASKLAELGALNQFWKNYYTSRVVKGRFLDGEADLGTLVTLNETKKKFIVLEKISNFDATGAVRDIKVSLYTNVEDN